MLSEDEFKLQEIISQNTVRTRVKGWIDNFFANLSIIQGGLGVRVVNNVLKGMPAIVVGAGPSLDKNLAQLKDLRDKACMISCDASLEAVLKAGCKPHIVLSAESKERVKRYLTPEGFSTEDLLLVADTRLHPASRDAWKGEILWYNSMPIENFPFSEVSVKWTGQLGALGSGGCVTTTIWCLAQVFLKNSPIIHIGQDCSFKDVTRHHANAVKNTELYTTDQLEDELDINGDKVYTNGPLKSFRLWLENIFVAHPGIYVNCTEGGTLTRGCLVMSLEEATEMFLKDDHPIDEKIEAALEGGVDIMNETRNEGLEDKIEVPIERRRKIVPGVGQTVRNPEV